MFLRRRTSETFFIGRPPRLRREAALAEAARLLDEDAGEQRLRAVLAEGLPAGKADNMTEDDLLDAVADGLSTGRLVLIGRAPRPWSLPTLAEGGAGENEDSPPPEEEEEETDWLEIELLDEGDPPQPIPNVRYVVELKDGTIIEGKVDAQGKASVTGVPKGSTAKVSFPDIDAGEWK